MFWVDYVLLAIVLISALISLARGFVREAFSLAIWVLAFWISWSFFRELQVHFQPWVESPTVRLGAAFALLMTATLIIGGMVNYLIIQLIERTGMSGTDRFIGMIFGMARGVLLNAILILLAGLTTLPQESWWKASQLIPYFQELALWLKSLLPEDLAQYFHYADSSADAGRGD
jgi:membrane protein required for colicin V production